MQVKSIRNYTVFTIVFILIKKFSMECESNPSKELYLYKYRHDFLKLISWCVRIAKYKINDDFKYHRTFFTLSQYVLTKATFHNVFDKLVKSNSCTKCMFNKLIKLVFQIIKVQKN